MDEDHPRNAAVALWVIAFIPFIIAILPLFMGWDRDTKVLTLYGTIGVVVLGGLGLGIYKRSLVACVLVMAVFGAYTIAAAVYALMEPKGRSSIIGVIIVAYPALMAYRAFDQIRSESRT